ncbi:DUF6359 domain-containing protein [Bacteroides sp. GM023]|uniref:DUF6359 domain-containing protein n=1 Tax=Bacteroides sp. GM023 TaxID=2723058 RepID=UPI00168B3D15|nr:DUF6359 domain-containing protein [Bacteroides sp. GM023]MBD3590877.1 lamin tail domain-containing protein [Bacteroides sp. GM023]
MKKILNALFLTLLTVFTFSSCSDVPAPYDILGEGDVPGLTGDGTKENPYNIEAAQQKQDGSVAWVQGYIVGAIENVYDDKGEFAGNKASFTAPFTITSNILIAESPDETNESKCLPVKVKNGSDLSTALNLKDHPENKGGVLLIQGELSAGFGKAALINTTAAVFNNKEIGEEQGGEDPEPPVGNVTFFEEAFASNKGSFTIEDKTRPTKVDEIWKWESYTPETGGTASTYMKASAFISATEKEASESWLISPAVDLTKATSASLTFEHAHKFCGDPSKELTVWAKESTASDWIQVTIPTYATNSDWKFVSSGSISLSSYVGKNMQFAFKYMSTTSDVGTWEVRNVKVTGEGEGGGEPTPPVEGTKIFVETFGTVTANTNVEGYQGWDNSNLTFSVNNPKVNLRTSLHKTEANKTESTVKISHIWFPSAGDNTFTISKINAEGYNKFVLYYEEAANTYNAGSSIDLNVLKIKFNGTEVIAGSKVVTAQVEKDDANIFYEMQVELNIAGTANSTLEFSALETENTLGLRLANIRLYAISEGGGTDPEPVGSELFISEYVESFKGNNKYVEIYNPTSESVDLSGYSLKMNTNGKKEGEEIVWTSIHNKAFTGTIEPGHVVVFANNQAVNYTGEAVKCSAMTFNGDDAIGLFKGETLIDLMGTPGVQEKFGENVVLRRVATVTNPNTTYALAEWSEIKLTSADDDASVGISGLGSHTVE